MSESITSHSQTDKTPASGIVTMTALGTVFQLAMVVAGHYSAFVRDNVFAIGGMLISLVFAVLFARSAAVSKANAAVGGLIVGGVCALIGIAVCVALGDTQANILFVGTAGSAIAGLIGGFVAFLITGERAR